MSDQSTGCYADTAEAHSRSLEEISFLHLLRSSIKQDTLNALRTAPLHMATLFSDSALKKTEEDTPQFENKSHSGLSAHKKGYYHP